MSKKLTQSEFIKIVQNLYPDCDFSKAVYTGWRCSVTVIHPILGEVIVSASRLKNGTWKGIKNGMANRKLNNELFIQKCKDRFPDKNFDYSKLEYKNNDTKVTIGCPIHGFFEIRPGDFLRQSGCPLCKPKSLGEIFIENWLKENNISYIHNFYIKIDDKKYFIDFKVGDVYIEYNGKQHYEESNYFKCSNRLIPFSLEKQQKRDQLIQEYCDNNNIKIIWIKYDIPKSEVLNILKQNLL